MSEEKKTVKQKIIEATIECIEKEGFHAATNRSIAKEAGVNSAAINYYFGTKENLIEETLKTSLDNAFTDPLFENLEVESFEEMNQILKAIFVEHLNGMLTYPGLSKAHLYNPFVNNDYTGIAVKRYNQFMENLYHRLKPFVVMTSEELKMSMVQIYAAIFMVGMMPGMFQEFYDLDLHKQENQEKFIDYLLEKYFLKK